MSARLIDAYAHCGLRKYRPYDDVDRILREQRVERAVLVQHLGEFDNSYIEGIVAREPHRFAGVFVVDLSAPRVIDDITHWHDTRRFRAIRVPASSLLTHRGPWYWAAQLGLQFIVYDSPWKYAGALRHFANQQANNTIVLAHLGLPDFADTYSQRITLELSAHPNICVQISGMHQFDDPPYRKLSAFIACLYEAYGADRLLYGSNFPVMKEESVYALEWDLARRGKLGVPASAAESFLYANALRVYF
ncbi:MAG: amidohydrolase family protein [Bryobacteraceae bacterium]|nr:amidohydrolase family protein [Bryobacteraceae bacterium]